MKVSVSERIFIMLILIAAAAIRVYELFQIPFTYDELSALLRTRFDSFGELIQNGVRIDGHPAGIQVFLFYLTKITGFNEGWVKLPFIAAGVASVYLIWKIGREWFSPTTGMLAAVTLAFMQYFVIYSQIARPYSSGVFFTLLMLLGWTRITFLKSGNYWRNFILFVAGGTLCAYNHYFSMLMVVLAGIVGLFLVRGKKLKRYLLAGAILLILFIPHLEITFFQFGMRGVEQWLNKPTPEFFIDYGKYIFHFSIVTSIVFTMIVLFGVIRSIIRKTFHIKKTHVIALLLGILPIVIGYVYSIEVAALLQFSVLIFSFPLLILLAFSFFENTGLRLSLRVTIVWAVILIFSLISTRKHYEYFYHSVFEESTQEIKAFTQTHNVDSTLVVCSFRSEVADIYRLKYGIDPKLKYIFPDSLKSTLELKNYLSDSTYKHLILAKGNEDQPWLYALCHEYFAVTTTEKNFNQGTCFVLERGEANYLNYLKGDICTFDKKSTVRWNFDTALVSTDTLNSDQVLKIDSSVVFETGWTRNTLGYVKSRARVFDATAWVYLPDSIPCEILWVASLESDTGTIVWNSAPINASTVNVGEWTPVSVSVFLTDIRRIPMDAKLKVYIWNKSGSELFIRQTFAGLRAGNPSIYWITYNVFD